MNRYLLCRKRVNRPYVVQELGLRIYSPEELCYFIYQNLPLIDNSFLDENFYEFIGQDCGMPETARQMERCAKASQYPLETLRILFPAVGYYTEEECSRFSKRLMQQLHNSPDRIYEEKADLLVKLGRYQEAVQYYEKISSARHGQSAAPVLEKMAGLYFRMGHQKKAMEHLLTLWKLTKEKKAARALCFGCLFTGQEVGELGGDIPQALQQQYSQEYEHIRQEVENQVGEGPVETVMTDHFQGRREELEAYFYEEKQAYRKMMGIE